MIEKFHSRFDNKKSYTGYDHIIVGSGIGALTAAAILSKGGYKVLVLEKHYKPGGFSHTFKRSNGYQWDVGVHYIGNVGKDHSLRKMFDYLTNGELEWESMGKVYDVVNIGDKRYEFVAGVEEQKQQLIGYFPKEALAINRYFELIKSSNKWANAFFFEKTFKPILSHTIGWFIRRKFKQFSSKTTYEVLSELTSNKDLIAVLCGQCGNYGLAPKESSFAAHCLVIGHFLKGGFYPKGGAEKISSKIIKLIDSLGSKIVVKAAVESIVVENNKVQGVMVADKFIPCKSVISTVGVHNTLNKLISEDLLQEERAAIEQLKPSTAHLCLYLGLNKSDEELQLPKYNIWSYASQDIDACLENLNLENAAKQFSYISFPSAKDEDWQKKHPHKATLQALSKGNYEWFKAFENLPTMHRGTAYEALKKKFEESMLETLYKLCPQLKGNIAIAEVSTPLSTKHYSSYQHGEIYGLEHSPKRFATYALRFETKIKGLRLAGQDTMVVGVAGALNSGLLCATTILKFKSRHIFKEMGEQKYSVIRH